MKMLIITNHSYMLYQFRRELIEKLSKHFDIVISTPCVGHEKDLKEMGCHIIETNVDRRGINAFRDCRLLRDYHRIIRNEKPDKVVTYSIKPNIYAGIVCRYMNIPYYANVQGLGTAFQNAKLAKLVTCLYKYALKKANTVFFENKENAEIFIERNIIPPKKVKVLNGAGVNLEHYKYNPYPKDKKIRFLFVGRIMKEKGVEELFEAFERLCHEYDTVLDIAGFFEDEYKEKVEQLVNEGFVCFHGFQEDVRPYYQKAHCIVLPSYHEGMSNVLLEAGATGRPVITGNIPGCREAVEDGKNGYLVKVKDSEDLYKKMKKFIELEEDQKEKMGRNGRAKMEKEFSKEKIVRETYISITL